MSETDRTAIEIVKNLQTNLRRTLIAISSILFMGVCGAIFWGGAIDNQVEHNTNTGTTNSQDIKDLTTAVRDYFADQRVENTKYVTKDAFNVAEDYWDATNDNLDMIKYWAKSRGFEGVFRSPETETKNN